MMEKLARIIYEKPKLPQELIDDFEFLLITDMFSKLLFMLGSLYFAHFVQTMLNDDDITNEEDVQESRETVFENISEKSSTH